MQKVVIFVNIWYIWNICYICNIWKIKSIVKSEIIVIIHGTVEALRMTYNLKHSVPIKVPIVFNNGSNYDYHFIIKELEEKFKKQFICLDGNTEKYIAFTVPIEKAVRRIDKNEKETTKNISYILQFIDSARFMASSLSNLVNHLSEGIRRIKCK